jgi:hypothetical protein
VAQGVTIYACAAVTGILSESNPPRLDQLRLWPPGLGESPGMSMAPAKGKGSCGAMVPVSRAMSQSRSKRTSPWIETVSIGVQLGPAPGARLRGRAAGLPERGLEVRLRGLQFIFIMEHIP